MIYIYIYIFIVITSDGDNVLINMKLGLMQIQNDVFVEGRNYHTWDPYI